MDVCLVRCDVCEDSISNDTPGQTWHVGGGVTETVCIRCFLFLQPRGIIARAGGSSLAVDHRFQFHRLRVLGAQREALAAQLLGLQQQKDWLDRKFGFYLDHLAASRVTLDRVFVPRESRESSSFSEALLTSLGGVHAPVRRIFREYAVGDSRSDSDDTSEESSAESDDDSDTTYGLPTTTEQPPGSVD